MKTWLDFGDELVNVNAVSQIIKKEVNGRWTVEFFRIDGSYMTSFQCESEEDATVAFKSFSNVLDALKWLKI